MASANHTPGGPIQIDLKSVIESRLGDKARRVPVMFVRGLERLIRQDELNELLRAAYPRRGGEFCRAVLEHLDVKVELQGAENLPAADDRHVILVCNHPLGGLDGMALIAVMAEHFGCEPYFVVNDLLMAVEPLTEVFLPINKHGRQSRASIEGIDRAMASDRPILIFPAGLCSRLNGAVVADLAWQKMFVQKAREFGRDLIPMHFAGRNSSTFYRAANWRKRLGIKFNAEMALLPGEIFKAKGKTFTLKIGRRIAADTLSRDPSVEALRIRKISDNL